MLTFDEVTVRYTAHTDAALAGVSFSVSAGERVALVGPSGAGKTTLLSAANGLVVASEGCITVGGVDASELGWRRNRGTRRTIGTIAQNNALVGSLPVAQNVAAGRLGFHGSWHTLLTLIRPQNIDEISELLSRVGIADKLYERVDQLSGGQQQRVAIARTLFQEPNLILADEPVSALDPARSVAVMELLTEATTATPGRALVASMHDAELAQAHFTRLIGLRSGQMVFDAPAHAVTAAQLTSLYQLEVG